MMQLKLSAILEDKKNLLPTLRQMNKTKERLKKWTLLTLREMFFLLDFHIGNRLLRKRNLNLWRKYMIETYPEKYENEIKFMQEKKERMDKERDRLSRKVKV